MKQSHHRLAAETPRGLAGSSIDRSKPIRFRLNGREISGFSGDTVLSAALANGINMLGHHGKTAVGLTPSASPVVYPASHPSDPRHAVPMSRTPATNGADYVTHGTSLLGGLVRLVRSRTLAIALDKPHRLDQPWRQFAAEKAQGSDLIVVGGGVAGLSAALAAARIGVRTTLVEASPQLGGHSGLFGTQDSEDSPTESMARLARKVQANDAITVLTSAQAFALRPGRVRVHQVDTTGDQPRGHILDLDAPQIIIATGALERLPIFAGNRLPVVIGSLDAYELAARYGVWPGRSSLFATISNPAYRLAMMARDAGIAVPRIIDGRGAPASRFIEFSRAYGIVQSVGAQPRSVRPDRSGALLLDLEGSAAGPFTADRIVVSGGWQPDLTLWHVAGGGSRWHPARHRLEAEGTLDGVMLAGSAAGYFTRYACIASGTDAVDALFGRPRKSINDPVIDAIYETPDGPLPVAAQSETGPRAYLDGGAQLLARPKLRKPGLPTWLGRPRQAGGVAALSQAPQPLTVAEVAAGVDLGLIPQHAAGVVAQERVALVPLAHRQDHGERTPQTLPAPDHVPDYLTGRFGPDARVVRLVPEGARRFEPGSLVYRSADLDQPLMAIGVVLRQHENAALALLNAAAIQSGQFVSVRDHGRAFFARLVDEKGV